MKRRMPDYRSRRLPPVAAILLCVFTLAAGAGEVSADSDSDPSVAGELRNVIENALAGDSVTFAGGITEIAITQPAAIAVGVTDLTLTGNGDYATVVTTLGIARATPIFMNSNGDGNGLTLVNMAFENVVFDSAVEFSGGGILAVDSVLAGTDAALGGIDARFSKNTVNAQDGFFGGGLAGAHSQYDIASIGNVSGAFGSDITDDANEVRSTFITGGGLIGAVSARTDALIGDISAQIGDISANFFRNRVMTAGMFLGGGGLVGAVSTISGDAIIGNVSGRFGGDAAGAVNVVEFTGSVLYGGGLVGANASTTGSGIIGTVSGTFGSEIAGIGNSVLIPNGVILQGGGLVGVRSVVVLAKVENVSAEFFNNTVDMAGHIEGAGLVGVNSAKGAVTIGTVSGKFGSAAGGSGNMVAVGGPIQGGGLVGGVAGTTGTVEGILGAGFFGNSVTTGGELEGGGLVGLASREDTARIGNVSGTFGSVAAGTGNVVNAGGYFSGGGLVGNYGVYSSAEIGAIDAQFIGNRVESGGIFMGGGIAGAASLENMAATGVVSGVFDSNTVAVGGQLAGGGVLGAYASAGTNDNPVLFGDFSGASFTGNSVSAVGWALGGIIGTSGLDATWTIADTVITGNSLTVASPNTDVTAGTIYIGTDRVTGNASGSHDVVVTGDTVISGNTVTSTGETVNSSFHFGRGFKLDFVLDTESHLVNPVFTATMRNSLADASLTLAPGAGETVTLTDPVTVDMNGYSFDYRVNGSGTVILGGVSRMDASGGDGSAFTASSGTLRLTDDFSLTKNSPDATANNGALHVTLDNSGGDLRLEFELRDRDGDLAMFESPDSFTVTGDPESKVIDAAASGRNFSPDAITGKWLVTDKRYGVDASYFSPIDSGGADLQFLIEGDSLYISGLLPGAPDDLLNHPNPNVRESIKTGSLEDAWEDALDELHLSPADEDALYDRIAANPQQMTAEPFAARAMAALDAADRIAGGVRAIAGLDAPGGWGRESIAAAGEYSIWAGSFAGRADRYGHGGLGGYDSRLYGGAVGGTAFFSPALRTGLYLAYARDNNDFDILGAENSADVWQAGGYLEVRPTARWGMRFDLSHTWFDNDLSHVTPAGSYGARFTQRVFSAGLESGYDFSSADGRTRLTPFAGFRWHRLSQDRGEEKAVAGASAALASSLGSLSADSRTALLGVELARDFQMSCGRRIQPSVRIGWRHEFGDKAVSGVGSYASGPGTYRVVSLERSRDAVDIGARLSARLLETPVTAVDVVLDVHAAFAGKYREYGIRAGVGVAF